MLRRVSWIVFWPTVFTAEREIFPPKMRVHVVKAKCRETLGCRSLQIPMWPWQVAFCRFVWNRYQGTDYDYRLLSLILGVLRTTKMTLIHTLFFLPKCLRVYDTYTYTVSGLLSECSEIPVVLPWVHMSWKVTHLLKVSWGPDDAITEAVCLGDRCVGPVLRLKWLRCRWILMIWCSKMDCISSSPFTLESSCILMAAHFWLRHFLGPSQKSMLHFLWIAPSLCMAIQYCCYVSTPRCFYCQVRDSLRFACAETC